MALRRAPRPGRASTTTVALAVTTLVALALRLFRLGRQPYWLDEGWTVAMADYANSHGWWAVHRVEFISPAYYWLAATMDQVAGDQQWSLRLPAAIAGTLVVPLTHWVAVELTGSRRVGLVAAVLMALSPTGLWYSQEARGYSFVVLLATAYLWVHWRLVERAFTTKGLLLLFAAAAGLLWFNHAGAFVFVVAGLHLLWRWGIRDRRPWLWLVAHLAAFASFAPWFAVTWSRLGQDTSYLPDQQIGLRALYNLYTLVVGQSYGPSSLEIREQGASSLAGSLPQLALLGLAGLAVALAAIGPWRRLSRSAQVLLALWLVVPLVLLVAMVLATGTVFHARYLLVSLPALGIAAALAGAQGLRVLRVHRPGARAWLAAVGTLALLLVFCWADFSWFTDPRYAKEDAMAISPVLAAELRPGDTVLIGNENAVVTMVHTGFRCTDQVLTLQNPDGIATLATMPAEPTGRTFLVEYRQWERGDSASLRAALAGEHGQPVREWHWNGADLSQWQGAIAARPGPGLKLGCNPPA